MMLQEWKDGVSELLMIAKWSENNLEVSKHIPSYMHVAYSVTY